MPCSLSDAPRRLVFPPGRHVMIEHVAGLDHVVVDADQDHVCGIHDGLPSRLEPVPERLMALVPPNPFHHTSSIGNRRRFCEPGRPCGSVRPPLSPTGPGPGKIVPGAV